MQILLRYMNTVFSRRNQSPGREDGAESPQDISPSDDSRQVDYAEDGAEIPQDISPSDDSRQVDGQRIEQKIQLGGRVEDKVESSQDITSSDGSRQVDGQRINQRVLRISLLQMDPGRWMGRGWKRNLRISVLQIDPGRWMGRYLRISVIQTDPGKWMEQRMECILYMIPGRENSTRKSRKTKESKK